MTALGIFTVKHLCRHEGQYYTYGGFGDYLSAIRRRFSRTILVAHVKDVQPPPGHYLIPGGSDIEIVGLPWTRSQLAVLLTLPVTFWRSWRAARLMDIAHVRMPDYTGIVGAVVCRARKVPMFCQIIDDWYLLAKAMPITRKRGLGVAMKLHLYLYDFFERRVCRGQLVFAQGHTCYEKHRRHSNCELAISAAHHISDVVPPRPRFRSGTRTILSVGRLSSVKNHALIISAVERLKGLGQPWRLVLVGEGPQRDALKSLAERLGVSEHLVLAGHISHGPELWRFFDEADCFVLSSRSEGTPKVLLEAMARGLPIVASAVAGVPTILGADERGLLFPDNDTDALVNALQRIAEDESLRDKLVMNGHVYSLSNTVERVTEAMLEKVFSRWPYLRVGVEAKASMPVAS